MNRLGLGATTEQDIGRQPVLLFQQCKHQVLAVDLLVLESGRVRLGLTQGLLGFVLSFCGSPWQQFSGLGLPLKPIVRYLSL